MSRTRSFDNIATAQALSVLESSTTAVSRVFTPTAYGCRGLRVMVKVDSATSATAVLKLQQSPDGVAWTDIKSSTVATSVTPVWHHFTLLDVVAADQTHLPLMPQCRVVAVTGAAEVMSISIVQALQEV